MPSRKLSAGLLMCRLRPDGKPEVLLAHPGGPYFARRDEGAWTVPKGLIDDGEEPIDAAKREFAEETGFAIGTDVFHPLDSVKHKNGKVVQAWAFAGDCDPEALHSNEFEIEWPPRSGKRQSFPEVDRVGFFDREAALLKILEAQQPLIERACTEECLAVLFAG